MQKVGSLKRTENLALIRNDLRRTRIAIVGKNGLVKMVRPGGFELPAFWFVANGVKMLNALFGVAYGLERHSSLT